MDICRILPDSSYSLAKMLYTKEIAPRPVWKFLFIAGFLCDRLSGKAATDVSLACRSLLYDVKERRWSDELLGEANIRKDQLPEVVQPGTALGRILPDTAAELGLPETTLVVIGTHDQIVNALGVGVQRVGDAVDTSGTCECVTPLFTEIPKSPDFQRDNFACVSYMEQALKLGFTGVMYDGSVLPYEENVANTRIAVAMAKDYGAGVEAEIGTLASREGGQDANAGGPVYTDPDLAVQFCRETGIDALAPSFGTAHGIYKSKPVLDLNRVKVIAEKTGLPLVMHGGSGVSPEDYRTGIRNGLRKINYYSYMSKAGTNAVKAMLEAEDVTFFHDLALAAQQAMEADAAKAMCVFANK